MARPMFRAAPMRVRVPATSANLGPGFDSLALALSLHDDVVAQVSDDPGVRVDVHGEGAETLRRDSKHLVAKAMLATFDRLGGRPRGLELVCANRIPHGRGLGSSAAAIVSGVVLARALVVGGDDRLPDLEALQLAAALEGHPDNVAAALFGGLTVTWTEQAAEGSTTGRVGVVRHSVRAPVVPVVCVPSTQVSTAKARRLIPEQVPHGDAVANLARTALLLSVLTDPGPADLLMVATEDRLHQAYRRPAYPRSCDLVAKLRRAGVPATISGAGPTVLAWCDEQSATRVEGLSGARFSVRILDLDDSGATLVPL